MSNRDRVSKNQSGGQGEIPRLPIDIRLTMKENPTTGKPSFALWDKENKVDKFGANPLKGLLIGFAMIMRAFDETLGKFGLTITSAPYVSKDNIVIFDPQTNKKLAQGTKEEITLTIAAKYPHADKPGVGVLLYLYTFPAKGQPGKLYEIATNSTLAFDGMKQHQKDLVDNYTILIPTLYDTADLTITGKAHEGLGKFAKKNPPKYAKITIGERIPDELYDTKEVSEILDAWDTWKNFQLNKKEVQDAQETPNNDNNSTTRTSAPPPAPKDDFDWMQEKQNDDLPF